MTALRLIAALLCTAIVSTPASAQTPSAAVATQDDGSQRIEGIAAVVNDQPISYSDVRERARLLLLSLGGQPTQEDILRITSQALEQLIDEKLQLEKAAEFEVEIAAEEVTANIADMASQSGLSQDQLYQQLSVSGINPRSLEEQTRAEIAWRRIMNGLYGSRIRISGSQIDERLDQLRAASQVTQYRVAEIFLFAPDSASKAQAVQAANSIRSQLIDGAPFPVAAQRFSSAPTSATGGDMGWVSLDDVEPEISDALVALGNGGLSPPIVVGNGVYLIALTGKREPEEADTQVALTRLLARDGSAETLAAATQQVTSCDAVETVAEGSESLQVASLGRISLSELASDAAARIENTAVGEATIPFETSNGLAVMYVCERSSNVGNLPSEVQIENQLFGRQLSMISDRELRNLRREATIIYRE
ncbi:MAG: peptidylprolyl isomerase [Pseudomonadota bacterium]